MGHLINMRAQQMTDTVLLKGSPSQANKQGLEMVEPLTPEKVDCPDSPRMKFRLVDVSLHRDKKVEKRNIVLRRSTIFAPHEGADVKIDATASTSRFHIYAKQGQFYLHMLSVGRGSVALNNKKIRNKKIKKIEHGDLLQIGGVKKKGSKMYVMQHVPPNAENIEDDMRCAICYSIFSNPFSVVPCGHNFCRDCIGAWLEAGHNLSCPTCNARITIPFALPNPSLRNVIEAYCPAIGIDLQRKIKTQKRESLEAYITPKVLREGTLRVFNETKCSKYPMCCN